MKKLISTFNNRDSAEKAVADLRRQGFDNEISIIAQDDQNASMSGDTIADGATAGGALGGLAGLAIGAGALAIPGFGPLVAAGPLAGLLSGAATGGIAGGLVDWGIPAERSQYYEDKIKQGHILVSIEASDDQVRKAEDTLKRYGASDVETH